MNTQLEARVDELEARVAFQELTVTELSDALAHPSIAATYAGRAAPLSCGTTD